MKITNGKQRKVLVLGFTLTIITSLLLSSGVVIAQESDPEVEPPEPAEEAPKAPEEKEVENKAVKPWTFMVYMAAEQRGIEFDAIDEFMEMSEVGSTPYVNIVVQLDRCPDGSTDYGDWRDTRRFYVTKGMTPTAVNGISVYEQNMGSPITLKNFINWAKTNYPAQKYALIIWGEAWGWYPRGNDNFDKGLAWDHTNNHDYLTNKELSTALAQATGNGTKKLELIGFDGDEMAQMEVHQHIYKYAKFGVGSETFGWVPHNWPYNNILNWLKSHYGTNGRGLAEQIAQLSFTDQPDKGTFSAIRYDSYYNTVISRLNTFSDKLIAALESSPSFRLTIKKALELTDNTSTVGYDLSDFAFNIKKRTKPGTAVYNAAANLITSINSMITFNKVPYSTDAKGVTIFIPDCPSDWPDLDEGLRWEEIAAEYKSNQWLARDTHWDEFLNKYFLGEITTSLIWESGVNDLDAHLWLPSATPYHVDQINQGSLAIFPFAELDGDDIVSPGPERIRISKLEPGVYQFAVYKYSTEATTLKNSGAVLKVYRNGTLIKTLNVSTAGGVATGRWWKAFTYNKITNTFSWTNTLATSPGSAYSVSASFLKK